MTDRAKTAQAHMSRLGRGVALLTLAAFLLGGVLGFVLADLVTAIGTATPAPSSSPARHEDDPAWRGLDQGNCVATVDGRLLFNLGCLTGEPATDCETLLNLWSLGPDNDRAGFAAPELCEPVRTNR